MSELLSLVGLSTGVALYAMLLTMVVRATRAPSSRENFDPVLLATALLGFAMLYQDYPFALADLFLRRALALLLLVTTSFVAIALFGFLLGGVRASRPDGSASDRCAGPGLGGNGAGARLRIVIADERAAGPFVSALHLVTVTNEKFTITYRLKDLEARLDPARFIHLGRGTLANIDLISRVSVMPGGTHVAILGNGQKLQVSRLQSRILRERFLRL
jgi:hypothetical protein